MLEDSQSHGLRILNHIPSRLDLDCGVLSVLLLRDKWESWVPLAALEEGHTRGEPVVGPLMSSEAHN